MLAICFVAISGSRFVAEESYLPEPLLLERTQSFLENTNPDSQKAAILALVNEGSLVNVTNSFTQETATVRQVPAPA